MVIKINLPILGQPSPDEPKDVHLVGRYAVGVTWADDHSSIYPFERLRLDDPTRTDEALESLTELMRWPRDITKRSDGHESVYAFPALRALCRCAGCTGGH